MARYLGFDGFRGGWVMAWIDDEGRHGFSYSVRIAELLAGSFKRAMIDIPIGLPDVGYRECDRIGRKIIGPSVFLGVRRSILDFDNPKQANRYYEDNREPKISLQLWGIKKKIKEVDDCITPTMQKKISESHPEIFFWERSNRKKLAGKKTAQGRAQRIKILKRLGFTCIDMMLDQRSGTGIGRDDLIDACACAIVARDAKNALGGDKDSRGLRMEIHY